MSQNEQITPPHVDRQIEAALARADSFMLTTELRMTPEQIRANLLAASRHRTTTRPDGARGGIAALLQYLPKALPFSPDFLMGSVGAGFFLVVAVIQSWPVGTVLGVMTASVVQVVTAHRTSAWRRAAVRRNAESPTANSEHRDAPEEDELIPLSRSSRRPRR